MSFATRTDLECQQTASLLANRLASVDAKHSVIIGVLPSGAWLALAISEKMSLPLEVLPLRALKDPAAGTRNIGIVTEHEMTLSTCPFDLPQDYIYHEILRLRSEVITEKRTYYANLLAEALRDRTVILVDDVVCSGDTFETCIKEVKGQEPRKVIVAAAYARPEGMSRIAAQCDQAIVLESHAWIDGAQKLFPDMADPRETVCLRLKHTRNYAGAVFNQAGH